MVAAAKDWKRNIRVGPGRPIPFGASRLENGTNFSIYTREAQNIALVLFPPKELVDDSAAAAPPPGNKPNSEPDPRSTASGELDLRRVEISLDPKINFTGLVWHVFVSPSLEGYEYMWRIGPSSETISLNGKDYGTNLCLDPYARMLSSPRGPDSFNNPQSSRTDQQHPPRHDAPRAVVPPAEVDAFDWKGVVSPKIPLKDLVIYEMHVRGFTASKDSSVKAPGTFLGVVEKIPYLRELGINCVELLPVYEFNEAEWSLKNPITGKRLSQYWGYSTVNFFSPMNRFVTEGGNPINEFRLMVRELHRAGIEVFLDVVFNHTAEMGDDFLPPGFYNMKGLAPDTYYIRDHGKFSNYSGCGNTVSLNNPIVAEWFHEAIRYWVHEMGVDGFRFDLASALTRDPQGRPMSNPQAIERITKDATLRNVKLIAEPWDCGGLYQVGSFPHYGSWAEWNGRFRDTVRSFVRGSPCKQDFATRLCGSEDLYGKGRKPYHSINFVVAHDGFSLRDLVSYNDKHNEQNGEKNNDGENHNNSWNCGTEGITKDRTVNQLRLRQTKNFMVTLMISAGVPMILMGDEYGHTKHGNNNAWCQDGELNYFNWGKCAQSEVFRFFKLMVRMRRTTTFLNRDSFVKDRDIKWHGAQPNQPNWDDNYNFLAFTLRDRQDQEDLYVVLNAGNRDYTVTVPEGQTWFRIVDTSLPSPRDFLEDDRRTQVSGSVKMLPFSSMILKATRGGSFTPASDDFSRRFSNVYEQCSSDNVMGLAAGIRSPTQLGMASPSGAPQSPSGLISPIPTTEARQPNMIKESASVVNLAAPRLIARSMSRWDMDGSSA